MDNNEQIFQQMQARFKQAMSTLPIVVGNEIVNFTKERFARQDWLGHISQPWEQRRSKKDKGRAVLRKSGRLERSIRVVSSTSDAVVVGSDVPYAQPHNDGFNGVVNVKSYQRNSYKKKKTGTGQQNKSGSEKMQTVTSLKGSGLVKAHTRKMHLPSRRFIGPSFTMVERLKKVATIHLFKSIH